MMFNKIALEIGLQWSKSGPGVFKGHSDTAVLYKQPFTRELQQNKVARQGRLMTVRPTATEQLVAAPSARLTANMRLHWFLELSELTLQAKEIRVAITTGTPSLWLDLSGCASAAVQGSTLAAFAALWHLRTRLQDSEKEPWNIWHGPAHSARSCSNATSAVTLLLFPHSSTQGRISHSHTWVI